MIAKRFQLTLFVCPAQSASIEAVRLQFNPVQHKLIKAHVTLFREHELCALEEMFSVLGQSTFPSVRLELGLPIRFAEGKGVMLPATGANETFHQLRAFIAERMKSIIQTHLPHITLMHPRNSTCTDDLFKQIKQFVFPSSLEFQSISIIEQDEGMPWTTLASYPLQ